MEHVVLNKYGKPFELGEEVIINNPNHSVYDQIGEIYRIRNYDNQPKLSIIFECGNVYKCKPQDIILI